MWALLWRLVPYIYLWRCRRAFATHFTYGHPRALVVASFDARRPEKDRVRFTESIRADDWDAETWKDYLAYKYARVRDLTVERPAPRTAEKGENA